MASTKDHHLAKNFALESGLERKCDEKLKMVNFLQIDDSLRTTSGIRDSVKNCRSPIEYITSCDQEGSLDVTRSVGVACIRAAYTHRQRIRVFLRSHVITRLRFHRRGTYVSRTSFRLHYRLLGLQQ